MRKCHKVAISNMLLIFHICSVQVHIRVIFFLGFLDFKSNHTFKKGLLNFRIKSLKTLVQPIDAARLPHNKNYQKVLLKIVSKTPVKVAGGQLIAEN